MAEKIKEEMHKGFADTKTRSLLIIIAIVVIVAILIGYLSFRRAVKEQPEDVTGVTPPPAIRAIPGVGEPPTREYIRLQQEQARREAEEALRKKGVALPTLIRPTYIDEGELAFPTVRPGEAVPGCSVDELRRARRAGVSAFELRCRGCDAVALKAAGYTAGELRDAGFTAKQLKDDGFNAAQLKAAGFNAQELKDAGFTAAELKAAGYSAGELKDAGFSDTDLKAAGFSEAEIARAALKKDCSIEALSKAHGNGVSAAELKACGATALKAAGYTAKELKDAGFSAGELRAAGFSAKDLKDAGFNAKQLRDAGFNPEELKNAGFSAKDLKDAGYTDGDLIRAGFSPEEVAAAAAGLDCSSGALRSARLGGVSAAELKDCGAAALKAAGFTAKDLKDAGFSAGDLRAAGFSAKDLKDAGFSARQLKDAGYTNGDLIKAGFSPEEIAAAAVKVDCSSGALRSARLSGVSAAELKDCGAAALKAAGFTAKDLKDAGFSAGDLRAAGFNAKDLKDAGFSAGDLRAAGFSAKDLKDAGFSARQLRYAGFSPKELADAGFSREELADAGFSPEELSAVLAPAPIVSLAPAPKPREPDIQTELARIRAQQAAQLSKEEWQSKMQELQQSMAAQVGDLLALWTPLPRQQYVEGMPDQALADEAAIAKEKAAKEQVPIGEVMKAGTIIFAVLDTGINSDQQSPIMATVVQGKLKGSKVLGTFSRVEKKVVLQFTLLSVPYLDRSIPINAYGIDPEIGRIALASSVNNHYLYRYGTLFASAFIGGLGEAIQNSKSTVVTNIWGGTTQVYTELSPLESALVALGNVGQKFSDVLAKDFDMPPTVRIRTGSGIGLLLMSDLTIPKGK